MRRNAWILALLGLLALSIPEPIRLHVIANSDTAIDQQTKLKVRDAVLGVMQDKLSGAHTRSEARQALLDSGDALQAASEATLATADADYGARLSLGWTDFPDKTYGETVYPAGRYEALRIVLGDGKGQNWWCVMYPPLCLGDLQGMAQGNVHFRSGVVEFIEYLEGRVQTDDPETTEPPPTPTQ